MKLTFLFLLISVQLFSQTFEKVDSILGIKNIPMAEFEIRIYKDYSTTTGLELFRFYKTENDVYKAEFHQTIARKIEDKIDIRIRKSKLNSLKNMEVIWMGFLNSDVAHLPPFSEIEYKLRSDKTLDVEIVDGEIIRYNTSKAYILDGVTYYVKFSSPERTNEFIYPNPESYLKLYPNVDELISFQELLDYVRNEFDIFKK